MFNRNNLIALALVIGTIVGCYYLITLRPRLPEPVAPVEKVLRYSILNATDTGTTTAVIIPSEVIIQIPDASFTASSTQVVDTENSLVDEKIETYGPMTIVSGTLSKPGTIIITSPGALSLQYTFIEQATSSPTLQ